MGAGAARGRVRAQHLRAAYLLDQALAGYREVSRSFTFAADDSPRSFKGLPSRVFLSKMPEWTSNVVYYSKSEFVRVNHALEFHAGGSLAVPILDPHDHSCCAVLEAVTTTEKADLDGEWIGFAVPFRFVLVLKIELN